MSKIIAELKEMLSFFVGGTAGDEAISEAMYAAMLRHSTNRLLTLKDTLKLEAVETACADFRTDGVGATATFSVSQLLRMLLVKYLFGLSYRACVEEVRCNLAARWFCGYTLFQEICDHTQLWRFERYLHQTHEHLLFDTVLRQIDDDLPDKKDRIQVGDTFGVKANAAKVGVTRLLRDGCDHLLTVLQGHDSLLGTGITLDINSERLFGKHNEKTLNFRENPEARHKRLCQTVRGTVDLLCRVRQAFASLPPAINVWVERLEKVLADEVTLFRQANSAAAPEKIEATAVKLAEIDQLAVKRRTKRGSYRIGSMTDPDATYRKHDNTDTIFGYNVSVAADEFVRSVHTATGSQPDQVGIVPLLAAQEEPPEQFVYDRAAGHGKTMAAVAQATENKTQLVVYPVSYAKRSDRFGPQDFTPATDDLSLTCPNNVTTTTAYCSGSGDGFNFRFTAKQCEGCPLWDNCRDPDAKPDAHRSVFISTYRRIYQKAVEYAKTEEFKEVMKRRPHIERIVSHLVNHNDARRARGRGLKVVHFQMLMAATAYNLKRWLKLRADKLSVPGRGVPAGC